MSTRDKLLAALAKPVGARLSGEKLARRLGISRTMVWKHIQALRAWGLPIEGNARAGYRVTGPIDLSLWRWSKNRSGKILGNAALTPALSRSQRGRGDISEISPHYFFSTASTQTLAKTGAAMGLAEGTLWIAEQQTAGRGRLERSWASGYGGLWISLLLRPPVPPSQVPSVTHVAAVALVQMIRNQARLDAKLKWPNDVVCKTKQGWKKLAGFLTEMSAEIDRTHWVTIGLGLNVNNELPPDLQAVGASLRELTGRNFHRAELLDAFLTLFRSAYYRWIKGGFGPFQRDYWGFYRGPQETVRLRTSQGLVEGIARGVDAFGGLIVESRRKIFHFSEGEIVL